MYALNNDFNLRRLERYVSIAWDSGAANAKWDTENYFDSIISDFLTHVTDDKSITARQCIKALAQVGLAKPQYISRILSCFQEADLSKYRDSMRPLIEKYMAETKKILTNFNRTD